MEKKEIAQTPGLGILGVLAQKPEVKDIWFHRKTVVLDGYKFVSCRFDGCQLNISSTHFEMHRCFLDESTTVYFAGNTVRLIRLFNSRYSWIYEKLPQFAPVRNDDGTITIAS